MILPVSPFGGFGGSEGRAPKVNLDKLARRTRMPNTSWSGKKLRLTLGKSALGKQSKGIVGPKKK